MDLIFQIIRDNFASIITGFAGLGCGLIFYLSKRLKYRTAVTEAEIQKVELEKVIAAGSYLICPSCGKKIFISDAKIYTGGVRDENKNESL